ncbi:MAG: hypothetical protein LBE09_03195 [Christensenellaceae bacterium]|jgi:hypothetical protein|nr:hypothetical protein [Christensenellaceae bacterium]
MSKKFKIATCLILVIVLCVTILVGCTLESPYFNIGLYREGDSSVNESDGMFSCGALNSTDVFDETDVMLDFYFGYKMKPTRNSNYVAVVVAFLKDRSVIYSEEHDDYRNIPDFFIAREFTVEDFFSIKYEVKAEQYTQLAYSHHEKFIVPQEIYMSQTQKPNVFHFAVLSVNYNAETKKYNFFNDDYSIYHLISISYNNLGDGKIKLGNLSRPLL